MSRINKSLPDFRMFNDDSDSEEDESQDDRPTILVLKMSEMESKAIVATDDDKWQWYIEEILGIVPYKTGPSDMRKYRIPVRLIKLFGKPCWPDSENIGNGSWYTVLKYGF